MQDRPTAVELLAAVKHFLEHEVLPAVHDDHRLRFRTLIAANALTILQRELSADGTIAQQEIERLEQLLDIHPSPVATPGDQPNPPHPSSHDQATRVNTLRLELARRIRAGTADHGPWRQAVIAATLASVRAKLSISNPKLVDPTEQQ
jgi:Domain of unknown function (DUF6285)